MSGAGMLGTQFQQRGEKSDPFKVRRLCPSNWSCLLERHGTFDLSTGPYAVKIKIILVLTVEIHSCMCVMASSQLDGPVADALCICWLRCSLGQSWGGCAHTWRYINVHLNVHVHPFVCQQHKNHSSLGCFGLHIDLLEQNICSLKYVESGNGQRLSLWEFSCCSGSPETRQNLALTKDDKQLLQPGNWST